MENKKYALTTESCYNPFFLECNGLREGEVNKINFFKVENGEAEIVASTRWFNCMPDGNKKYAGISSNNDFKSVELPYTDIPYRRKESFEKDKAFYLKEKDPYCGVKINLYLNVSELKDFEITPKEPETRYRGTELHTCDIVCFKAVGTVKSRWIETEDESEVTVGFTCNHNYAVTDFGRFCADMTGILTQCFSSVSRFDVADFIQDGHIDELIAKYAEWKETGKLSEKA